MHVCIYVCMYVCCMFVRKYVQIKYIYVCKHIYGGDNRQVRNTILQEELFYWYTFHFHGIPWSGVSHIARTGSSMFSKPSISWSSKCLLHCNSDCIPVSRKSIR